MTATCRVCHSEFAPTPNQFKKYDFICKQCRSANDIQWRQRRKAEGRPVVSTDMPLDYHRRYNAEYYSRPEIRAKRNAQARKRRGDPNEHAKLSARSAVKHALACGQIVKQPCFCGNTRVDAHHDDYSRPLQVVWLCRTHHVVLHHAKAEGVK